MYQYKGEDNTIAAVITPAGIGGVGVVRVSGADAAGVIGRIFTGKTEGHPSAWHPYSLHYGWVRADNGDIIDEVLVSWMPGPKSYTCEDVAEISGHGGPAVVGTILARCLQAGARLAEPGEFTKRAFLNGRIDLAQAEAVLDIISARTEAAVRAVERQLKGDLSAELEALRGALLGVLGGIEATLNFPEEDTDAGQAVKAAQEMEVIEGRLAALIATAPRGRILKEGIRVVICGKPNVGKSSLLNALLRAPRAIVTDVAGTTRDVIEECVNIDGIPVNLVDTAGILVPRDKVEEEAVRRSRSAIASADIILCVFDQSSPPDDTDRALMAETAHPRRIMVLNKSDLPSAEGHDVVGVCVRVSALAREGVDALRAAMVRMAAGDAPAEARGVLVNDARHLQALQAAREALERAKATASNGNPLEFAAEDIKAAVNALDAITGRHVDDDVIEHIFSKFCIGK
ncbi:MAG: tRNA uridine-5-carboxymethylaminomethyl(34) synthesis GTPase MnmE [Candidatus Omnitrophota bacterium]